MKREEEIIQRQYWYEEVDHPWLVRPLANAARYYAENGDEDQQVYCIKVEGHRHMTIALYIPGARRLGIYSGSTIAWASDILDVKTAIEAFVREPECWGELPHSWLP